MPGTAPLTSNRLRAGSASSTSRLLTVTRSLAHVPRHAQPLKTRPGLVLEPTEPGARYLSDWPWVLGPPLEMIAFNAAGKPLALGNADDINDVSGFKQADIDFLAGFHFRAVIQAELPQYT